MKRKPFLLVMTLAAGVLGVSAWRAAAQYSLNVVGYYNVELTPGFNLLANQLIETNWNANHVIGAYGMDGSLLYRFDPVAQRYYDAATCFHGVAWYPLSGDTNDPVLNLPLGESFFIWTMTNWTVTFVGGVAEGHLVNPLPAGFSLKASIVPQEGLLQTELIFPPYPGDLVWGRAAPAFSSYTYGGTGTDWIPSEPSVSVGGGFFLYRAPKQATPDHWWVRDFVIQKVASGLPSNPQAAKGSPSARISSLTFRNRNTVLIIENTARDPYNIQFSLDRVSWKTVATGQTGALWQEPARGGVQGYYQLVSQ